MHAPIPRFPTLAAAVAAILVLCISVSLMAFVLRHGLVVLTGTVALCIVLKYIKDLTN